MGKLKWLDFSLSDYLMLSASITGMIIFGSLLLNPNLLMNKLFPIETKVSAIGHVASNGENVRRRLARSFHWYDIYRKQQVFENDSILTGENSEARIDLNRNNKVHVKSNSLVKVSAAENEVMVDLRSGNVDLDIKDTILLKYKGKTAKVRVNNRGSAQSKVAGLQDGTKIKASIAEDGSIEINSRDSDISVEIENKVVKIKRGEKLNVASESDNEEAVMTKVENTLELMSPVDVDLWTDIKTKQVELNWENRYDEEREVDITVYTRTDRNKPYYMGASTDESYLIDNVMGEGAYAWEVESRVEKSETAEFVVIHKTPPALDTPYSNYTFDVEDEETVDIFFKWQDKMRVDNYRLQVSTDMSFVDNAVDDVINGSSLEHPLPVGTYYWRVAAEDDTPIDGMWSKVRTFDIAKKAPRLNIAEGTGIIIPDVPDLIDANPRTVTLKFDEGTHKLRKLAAIQENILNPPKFSWYPVEGATKFKFEVSKNPDFKKIEYSALTTEQEHTWVPMAAGQFFWRVRAETETGQSEFTQPVSIGLRLPAPTWEQFRIRKEILVDRPELMKKVVSTMKTNWNGVPLAKRYSLRVWKSGNFENHDLYTTADVKFKKGLPGNGDYFIQVAALSDEGRQVSAFSNPQKYVFNVKPKLLPPKLTTPLNGTQIVYFDEEISTRNSVIFGWTRTEGATSYEVELSRDRNFETIADTMIMKSNSFLYQKDFQEFKGDLFWRVRSKNGPQVYSVWSDISKLTVKPAPTFDKPRPQKNKIKNITANLVQ